MKNWKQYKNTNLWVHPDGRVMSNRRKTPRIIGKPTIAGYMAVPQYNTTKQDITIHQMVMEIFGPPKPDDPNITIDHIDGNKKNNAIENLQWLTRADNTTKFTKAKTRKLTFEQAQEIRTLYAETKTSHMKLAKQFNLSPRTIQSILKNKTYQK